MKGDKRRGRRRPDEITRLRLCDRLFSPAYVTINKVIILADDSPDRPFGSDCLK